MKKQERRARRKRGIRKKIHGTNAKPRVSVYRSNRHLYVQAIDDDGGVTLCAVTEKEAGAKRTREGAAKVWDVSDGRLRFGCGGSTNPITRLKATENATWRLFSSSSQLACTVCMAW